jgi:general secretion pathway protein L
MGRANGDKRVAIALPASQVLRKSITLPAAVEENLHQTLAYDLDRHTPFKADEVYFDAIVSGRDSARKEIRVDIAAALKSFVDQARRRVEAWGAQIVAVTPESPSGVAALSSTALNLLPPEERPDSSRWGRWKVGVPLAALTVAALIVIALPIWQKRAYAISLGHLVDQAKVQADASAALRDELERLAGDYNFALQRKYAFPAALQILEDVTKLLPDDTWLTQLEVKTTARGKDARREIVLRGESANAGRLVSLLEDSKVFEQAAPRSPTTKIQPGPGEIFDVGAQVKTQSLPQSVQLAELEPRPVPAPPAPAPPAPAPSTSSATSAPGAAKTLDAAPDAQPAQAAPSAPAAKGGDAPSPAKSPDAAPAPAPTQRTPAVPGGGQPRAPVTGAATSTFGPRPPGTPPAAAPVAVPPTPAMAAPTPRPALPAVAAPADNDADEPGEQPSTPQTQ